MIFKLKGYVLNSNIYLVLDEEKSVLIDCGGKAYARKILDNIKSILGKRKLDYVILTHRHYDHVGALYEINEVYRPRIIVHKEDYPLVRDNTDEFLGDSLYNSQLNNPNFLVLEESEKIIPLGNRHKLRIIHTPGHTSGSISCFDEKTGALFTGDLLFLHGVVGRWDFPSGDFNMLVNSIKLISTLDVKAMYPGHGECCEKNAKKHVELALETLRSLISE